MGSQEDRDADTPRSTTSDQHHDDGLPNRSEEARFDQLTSGPRRSRSHRLPTLLNTTTQPSISLHSTPTSAVEDDNPDRYYQQSPRIPVHKAEQKKRRFFGLGSSSKEINKDKVEKVGSTSVRRTDQPQQSESHNIDARNRTEQQCCSASNLLDDEEEQESGVVSQTSYAKYTASEKDPLRSPGFPPPLTHEQYLYARSTQQAIVLDPATRQPLERQSSSQSPRTARQQPSSYHPSPSSATSTSSHPFAHRAPHEALQHFYPDQTSRPASAQSLEPPPVVHYPRALDYYQYKQEQSPVSPGTYMQGSMGPPPTQQAPPTRRSSEATQQSSSSGGQGREGGNYQHYNQSVQQGPTLPSNAPPQYSAQLAPQGQSYRTNAQPSPMAQQEGRSTPPPNRSRDDLSGLDVGQLLNRHDELQDKYRKVKKYYFDKDAQVQQLQNTLAHQRLSQSRTSLDDNEYSNRFQRLDGAINNLAFNIRRDWRSIPPWLAPHVNRDAATQPTKEMTAVGRACISRWLVDELLERYFHPSLEPGFSAQLKIIEKNLRRFAAPTPSEEEKDSLLARISNWRLATLDGLHEVLSSSQAAESRASLTESLVEKLTASLSMMLKEPSPPGLEGGVSMIVELAVGIAANLPLESRDVFVEYVTPGVLVQDAWMKVEVGLPALTNPGEGPTEGDGGSIVSKQTEETGSIESRDTGTSNGNGNEETAKEMAMQQQAQQQQQAVQGKKKGMFTGFMGGAAGKKGSVSGPSPGTQPQQGQGQVQQQPSPPKEDRVRFSTFMAVEVRGRSVLVKAPVYVRE